MIDIKSVASNPIVWVGGAAIGLFLVLKAGPAQATGAGPSNAEVSATSAYNIAALNAVTNQAKISSDVSMNDSNNNTKLALATDSLIQNFQNNQAVLESQRVQSQAGITNAMITANTNIILDQANNSNRLAMTYVQADVSKTQAKYTYMSSQVAASAAKHASDNSLFSNIVGSVSKAAALVLG